MTKLAQLSEDLRDHISNPDVVRAIIKELNDEIAYCPILRNIERERNHNISEEDVIVFSDLGDEDRNEVYVYLGRILESVLTCILSDSFKVKKDRTSSGDLTIQDIIWEIKGTSAENSWTGSTHATKKEDERMNFIGVKYGMNKDVNIFDILNGSVTLIDEIFIGIFDDLRLIRKGTAKENSSRTQLYISIQDYDELKNKVAWGNLSYPDGGIYKKDGTLKKNVKYLKLEAA